MPAQPPLRLGAPAQIAELLRLAELQMAEAERSRQSLDTKAGLLLGFAGVIVGLLTERQLSGLALAAVVTAFVAGIAALLAALPRAYAVLDVEAISDQVIDLPEGDVAGFVLAEIRRINGANRRVLRAKGVALIMSATLLLAASALAAAGTILPGTGGLR